MHGFPAIFWTLIHWRYRAILSITSDLLLYIAQLSWLYARVMNLTAVRLFILVVLVLHLNALKLLAGCLFVSDCTLHLLVIIAEILSFLWELHFAPRTHPTRWSNSYMTCIGNVCLCSVVGVLMVYVLVIVLEVDLVLHLLRRLVLFKLMRHCVLLIPFHKFKF